MKQITYDLIVSFKPCYDPIRYISKDYSKSLIEFLKNEEIPFQDRLWLVLRTDFVTERLMRLFAVYCYRETLKFVPNPDPRSIECANVVERFANNNATVDELSAAESGAWSAAWSAARSAAESAARSAAWSAAWSAAESAARSAAWSAAWSAAASATASAARSAAWSAAASAKLEFRKNLQHKLIEMIEEEQKENKE